MRRLSSSKQATQSFERQYIKSYVKLLTQQVSKTAQKVDNYFFAEDGSEDDLKAWYGATLALCAAVIPYLYIVLN